MKKTVTIALLTTFTVGLCAATAHGASKHPRYYSEAELHTMDTNHDAMVSKDEFLAYSETSFNKMQLTDGMIILKGKPVNKAEQNESSMNNKPIGTTTDNANVNARDSVNGKQY